MLTAGGWPVSPLGFGTYRWTGTTEHVSALQRALDAGCSLVDTAPNYAPEHVRERLGQVLASGREGVFVISKAGYRDQGYCLDPAFVTERIESEARLVGQGYLDGFVLHNPEHLLRGASPDEALETMSAALAACADQVQRGTVRFIGVSSNVAAQPDHPLGQRVLERYADILHGLAGPAALLQFPYNVVERSADRGGWVHRCRRLGFTTIGNRPLSPITTDGPLRLSDRPTLAHRPTQRIVADVVACADQLSWLGDAWGQVRSPDALDHVARLAARQLGAHPDPRLTSLVEELLRAAKLELRGSAAAASARLRPLLGGDERESTPLRACRAALGALDHVLVGLRSATDVDELATLFTPRRAAA